MSETDEQHIRRLYRSMRAGERAEILNHMLQELKFLDPCENAADMGLNNYAKKLVIKVFSEDDGQIKSNRLWVLLKKMIGYKHGTKI